MRLSGLKRPQFGSGWLKTRKRIIGFRQQRTVLKTSEFLNPDEFHAAVGTVPWFAMPWHAADQGGMF